MRRLQVCCGVFLTALIWSAAGHASTGYFPNGWGPIIKGMAGAGIALNGTSPLSGANNPAAILGVADRELQLEVLLLHAKPEFDIGPLPAGSGPPAPGSFPLNPGKVEANPDVPLDIFIIPQGGMNWRINERTAFALIVYANGGLNTTYGNFDNPTCPPGTEGKGVFCGGRAGIDLVQVFIAPTLAIQVNDWWRVGVSPILALEAIEIRGLSAFAPRSVDADDLSDNGHDYALGYGLKIGTQVQATDGLSFAAVFQMETDIGSFDDYDGILPDDGQLDIPAYAAVGLAWRFLPRWTVAFDVQRVFYSDVAAQGNEPDTPRQLGAEDGPGFGWEDATMYKLGLRWSPPGNWTWRAGYSRVDSVPIDDDELFFNLLAQSILRDNFAVGATWAYSGATSLDLSFLYSAKNSIDGPNPLFPEQEIEVSLEGYELDLSWRHRF